MLRSEAWFIGFILVALFYVAVNIQAGWLYVLDFALAAFCFFAWILPALWIRGPMQIEHFFQTVFEGEPIHGLLRIKNLSKHNKYFLMIIEKFQALGNSAPVSFFIPVLRKGEVREFSYQGRALRRGIFSSPPVVIQSFGPAAFFLWKRVVSSHGNLVVYPRVKAFPFSIERILPGPQPSEEGINLGKGTEGEFFGIRNYESGDHFRNIHWPSTAKTGNLMVREMSRTHPGICMLYIDCFEGNPTLLFEESIRLAAYALQRIFEEGDIPSLFQSGVHAEKDWGSALQVLASLQQDNPHSLSKQIEISLHLLASSRHLLFFTVFPTKFIPDSWDFVRIFQENFTKINFVFVGSAPNLASQELSAWLKQRGVLVQEVFVSPPRTS